MVILATVLSLVMAAIHLYGGRLISLTHISRTRLLSFGGGIAVAYVFVHILPDLAQNQAAIHNAQPAILEFLKHHVYLAALLGMMLFYALERLAKNSCERARHDNTDCATTAGVFWVHVTSFALYNALIGYLLLHRDWQDLRRMLLFFVAMATHFLVNDWGLLQHHQHRYERFGRWVLAAAVIAGWAAGLATQLSPPTLALLFAFLAGGIILNVLKEELPEERKSNFPAFATGAAAYTLLLLLV